MSTKQDLQKQVKDLKNQVSQLKRSRSLMVNRVQNRLKRKDNQAPLAKVPSWGGESKPLRITQRERIATITANVTAGAFKADSFVINPANSTTFPWLHSIASLFDKYKFHRLKFTYVNNAGASTDGNVSLGVDFDTLDTSPASSVGMSNLAKFETFAPWTSKELVVPVNRRGNDVWLFCEDAQALANTNVDLKSYNLGNFYVSTEGMASGQVAGYLLVDYDVELLDKNPN